MICWLSPRWCKVWADLWTNKLRTALVVLSITVGVFAVGVVYSANLMFQRDLAQSWQTAAPASASLYADPFDEDLVESIYSLRAVKEADGRRNVDLRVRTASGEWRQMFLTAIPDYTEQKVNIVRPQAGAWPPGDGDVLVERSSLGELGVAPGDHIMVETPSGRQRTMKVTGVVYDASQIPSLFSGRAYGYINMDTLEKLDEPRMLDQINLVVDPSLVTGKATAAIELAGRQAWSKLEQGGTTVFWLQVNKPGEHPLQPVIAATMLLLAVLGGLALCLGTLLLVNTITAILAQQVRQVGIMKAIGANRSQIWQLYLVLVGAYGLLALVVAAPLGMVAANAMTRFIAAMFNFNAGGLALPLRVLGLEAVVAIIVPITAAIWPICHGTSVTVREAISDYGLRTDRATGRINRWVECGLKYLPHLPRPIVLSLRNTFRRQGRLLLTMVTLIVAGTVFMAVFSVRSSLYATLDEALDYFHYDISVAFTQSYRRDRIIQEALQVPGVQAAEAWGFTSGRILQDERKESEDAASHSAFLLAPPPDTMMIQPQIIDGRWLLTADAGALVVNTEVLKDNPHLAVGKPAVIKVGTRKIRGTVVGIIKSTLSGPLIYAPYAWLGRAVQDAGRARSVQIVAHSRDQQVQAALGRTLEQQLKKHDLKVQNVEIIWQQKQRIKAQFDILTNFLLIMAVLLAVVGALGLTGTMGINVLERTREIGVMRAIGASSIDIAKVLIVEALCIGGLSWVIGAILALPVAAILSYQVGMLFVQAPLTFTFSFLGVAIWLGLALSLAVAASLLPAANAARLSVRDVLSYE